MTARTAGTNGFMMSFSESTVEEAALGWLDIIGWTVAHGPAVAAMAPDTPNAERGD